jgi:metacaspase-1
LEHQIVWVHGIGDHKPGYSTEWEKSFNAYLNLSHESYVEVVWETVFDAVRRTMRIGRRATGAHVRLTQREQLAEAAVREQLLAILAARASAFEEGRAAAGLTRRGPHAVGRGVLEWSELRRVSRRGGTGEWLSQLNEYLGDFTWYLISKRVRTAVKEEAKKVLRPLADGDRAISIISHSWGTVVAYDTLLDLELEAPDLNVANLFTLGSPLWLVRTLLEDSSGRKPGELGFWMNIDALGDPVGSWLSPAFQVDRDYQVPSYGGGDPHGSYFVQGNEPVQHDLVANTILS